MDSIKLHRNTYEVISSMRDFIPSNKAFTEETNLVKKSPTQHQYTDNVYDNSSLVKTHFGITDKDLIPSNRVAEQVLNNYAKKMLEPFEKWKKEELKKQQPGTKELSDLVNYK